MLFYPIDTSNLTLNVQAMYKRWAAVCQSRKEIAPPTMPCEDFSWILSSPLNQGVRSTIEEQTCAYKSGRHVAAFAHES